MTTGSTTPNPGPGCILRAMRSARSSPSRACSAKQKPFFAPTWATTLASRAAASIPTTCGRSRGWLNASNTRAMPTSLRLLRQRLAFAKVARRRSNRNILLLSIGLSAGDRKRWSAEGLGLHVRPCSTAGTTDCWMRLDAPFATGFGVQEILIDSHLRSLWTNDFVQPHRSCDPFLLSVERPNT